MSQTILAAEPTIRLAFFLGVLAAMALWEVAAPRRRQEVPRVLRWTNNLGLVVVDTVILRLTFPILAVGLAVMAEDRGWGLFNAVDVPVWGAIIVSMLLLDLAIYLQHVMFHAVPGLWRLHRMHHADLEFDATTGLRFHPIEILISMGIKLAVVAALGPPAIAVLLFEVLLNATALFNHASINLPRPVDRVLRLFVVTPDMHRVHHSIDPGETNSNYGFNLPWWDRLLGTYAPNPPRVTQGWRSGSSSPAPAAIFGWTGCWRSQSGARRQAMPSIRATRPTIIPTGTKDLTDDSETLFCGGMPCRWPSRDTTFGARGRHRGDARIHDVLGIRDRHHPAPTA